MKAEDISIPVTKKDILIPLTNSPIWSGYKTAKSQNSDCYKTATTTKQRLLRNSDCYKTATFTKRRKIISLKRWLTKIFKEKNQRFYKES